MQLGIQTHTIARNPFRITEPTQKASYRLMRIRTNPARIKLVWGIQYPWGVPADSELERIDILKKTCAHLRPQISDRELYLLKLYIVTFLIKD